MKKEKKLLLITNSLLGITALTAIPILSCALFKQNQNSSSLKEVEEDTLDTKTIENNSVREMDPKYPTVQNQNVTDNEGGIVYAPVTYQSSFGSVTGYKVFSELPGRETYTLKQTPNPNFPDYPLISIDSAFAGNTTITTMPAIPETVLSMNNAFNGCTALTTFSNIPKDCERI